MNLYERGSDGKLHRRKDFKEVLVAKKYTDVDDQYFIQLFEKLGVWTDVVEAIRHDQGESPTAKTIVRRLKRKAIIGGWDFNTWVKQYSRHLTKVEKSQQRYYTQDIDNWIALYDQLGSFERLGEHLINTTGAAPNRKTFQRRIKTRLQVLGIDYNDWLSRNVYDEQDYILWKQLYERLGGFSTVRKHLIKNNFEKVPTPKVIIQNLRRYFESEGLDFNEWRAEFGRFKQYSEEDVNYWVELYEEIGSFRGISRHLRELGISPLPDPKNIKKRIRESFHNKGRMDFKDWVGENFQYYYEEICRQNFQEIFNTEFPSMTFPWLINPRTGRHLYLDGCSIALGLAFEYNGFQHYHFTPPYHKTKQDLLDQQYRDQIKKKMCHQNGIRVIEVPYDNGGMRNFIKKEYSRLQDI